MVRPCHMNSPRQKLAISSETNIHIPRGVKIGCDHQSGNGFVVHPSACAFDAVPVKSPKYVFTQRNHPRTGVAAHNTSAPSAGVAPRSLFDRACAMPHQSREPKATKIRGTLLTLVRYAAAKVMPV